MSLINRNELGAESQADDPDTNTLLADQLNISLAARGENTSVAAMADEMCRRADRTTAAAGRADLSKNPSAARSR
jgi:hypothetical protein